MKLFDDTNYARYMEWQRRLAPFSGTVVCLVGLLFLISAVVHKSDAPLADMSVKERVILGLVFEAFGLLFLRWGLKKNYTSQE